ncbi:MAG: PD40 domain-containing protein [Prevotella sp.]|nr:PD40 domain-containing protein [Prevotella sp.]
MRLKYFALGIIALLAACSQPQVPTDYTDAGKSASIYPDYSGVTIPINMAPLHFQLMQPADEVVCRFTAGQEQLVSEGPKVMPSIDDWRPLAEAAKGGSISIEVFARQNDKWQRYKPFEIYVSPDSIDPWLSYRLISPSYVTYEELTINQRCLENYDERVIYDNVLCSTEKNGQCINCHNYQNGNPQRMQFHARQNLGGTVINYDGKIIKTNLKTDSTLSAGVYPTWHPRLPLIAYSTNNTMQMFHTRDLNKIEVLDSQSDLILYDLEHGEVSTVENDPDEYEVFPFWSPDGKWLYYCSAHFEQRDTTSAETQSIKRYKEIKYNVYRKPFNEKTLTFGPREMVFDAASQNLSATLPRISSDGRWLLLSVGEWGCFHIWHRDADLWLMDLKTDSIRPFKEVNSPNVEAYHTWSRSGRWIVFSSRRYDGDFTRPFFAHVDAEGHATKPFELPCDDPDYHRQLMKSYNIPELMTGPVTVSPQQWADVLKQDPVPAKFVSRGGQPGQKE